MSMKDFHNAINVQHQRDRIAQLERELALERLDRGLAEDKIAQLQRELAEARGKYVLLETAHETAVWVAKDQEKRAEAAEARSGVVARELLDAAGVGGAGPENLRRWAAVLSAPAEAEEES